MQALACAPGDLRSRVALVSEPDPALRVLGKLIRRPLEQHPPLVQDHDVSAQRGDILGLVGGQQDGTSLAGL